MDKSGLMVVGIFCFVVGIMIEINEGLKVVELLCIGDLVCIMDNGF